MSSSPVNLVAAAVSLYLLWPCFTVLSILYVKMALRAYSGVLQVKHVTCKVTSTFIYFKNVMKILKGTLLWDKILDSCQKLCVLSCSSNHTHQCDCWMAVKDIFLIILSSRCLMLDWLTVESVLQTRCRFTLHVWAHPSQAALSKLHWSSNEGTPD